MDDEALAAAALARITQAKRQLDELMAQAGLRSHEGWRMSEEIRSSVSGTVLVFRPIHRTHHSGIEVTVEIDHTGRLIEPPAGG